MEGPTGRGCFKPSPLDLAKCRNSLSRCPRETGVWRRIPGYGDSDSDSDDMEEAALTSAAAERLKDLDGLVGRRWLEKPVIKFDLTREDSSPSDDRKPSKESDSKSNVPMFRIARINAPLVDDFFRSNGLCATEGEDWSIQWSGPGMREAGYRELLEHQKVNHFPGSTELTRKDRMWAHLDRMRQTFGDVFDFVPETFIMPRQGSEFRKRFNCASQPELWIVKPQNSSCGRGIHVLRSLKELPDQQPAVVSRYVRNPLLIQGLKFDLRIYVLVTQFDPLRAYIYREGLVRFASKPYSTKKKHLGDAFRHLTNYSVNKFAQNFQENKELVGDNIGHKWSVSALNKHLQHVGIDVDLMWVRIMDLVVKTLLAVEPVISARVKATTTHRSNCFELYGFDVLVDSDLKPWLMEVNLSPSMQAESPLDWQVKSAVLRDAFNLVGVHCPAPRKAPQASGKVPGSRTSQRKTMPARECPEKTPSSTASALAFESLGDEDLKVLARSFQEMGRCRNFIRLYPTCGAIERYAPIMDFQTMLVPRLAPTPWSQWSSLSQFIAAALFGVWPKPSPLDKDKINASFVPKPKGLARSCSMPAQGSPGGKWGAVRNIVNSLNSSGASAIRDVDEQLDKSDKFLDDTDKHVEKQVKARVPKSPSSLKSLSELALSRSLESLSSQKATETPDSSKAWSLASLTSYNDSNNDSFFACEL